jgi:hypothetical protein
MAEETEAAEWVRGVRFPADDVLAKKLGCCIVTKLAPEEMPLFEPTWHALGRHPGRRSRRREEPLGFGLPEVGEPIMTAVASGVALAVVQDLGKDFGSRWARLLARVRRRPAPTLPDPLPPLSATRLKQVRKIAHSKARKLGLSEMKAEALADAVVSELSTREPT